MATRAAERPNLVCVSSLGKERRIQVVHSDKQATRGVVFEAMPALAFKERRKD